MFPPLTSAQTNPVLEKSRGVDYVMTTADSSLDEDTSLDFYGRFQNPALQKAYIRSCLQQKSTYSSIFLVATIVGWTLIETTAGLFVYADEAEISIPIAIASFISIGFCVFFSICIYFLSKYDDELSLLYHSYCQIGLIFFVHLLFIIKLTEQNLLAGKECYASLSSFDTNAGLRKANSTSVGLLSDDDHYTHCPAADSFLSIVSLQMIIVLGFSPLILSVVLYEPRLYLFLGVEILLGGAMIAAVFASTTIAAAPIIILLIMLGVLYVEVHFQRVKAFLSNRKLQEILAENERNADANHAMEMRHMIGNVAHDLKTPLSSFTSGIDVIKDIITTANKSLGSNQHKEGGEYDEFKETFSSIDTCLTNIRNTNAFMLMTINRCIDYTKASKGMKLVPKYETVDLREALQFPIECMSNIQERIGIKLEAMSGDICSHIITDKQWLQENLLCLLSNAVKYSTEGSVTIKGKLTTMVKDWDEENQKEVSLFRQGSSTKLSKVVPTVVDEEESERTQFLLFEIEDTGIGVSEEAMKNLFNPFKQAQRLAGGTGLGLYSLAKRMESLKGYYGLTKRTDGKQGSLFWFAIPYIPDTVLSAASSKDSLIYPHFSLGFVDNLTLIESPNSSLTAGDSLLGKTFTTEKEIVSSELEGLEILIVDDSPAILKMSSMMLKRQGHQIWTAENGEIALKRIEEKWRGSGKGFDLVLMDLQMPVMDGLEATRRLRGMESEGREWMRHVNRNIVSLPSSNAFNEKQQATIKVSSHQVIIALSANSDDETSEEALRAGVDDFFGKPFSLDTFNKMIIKYIHD